MSNKITFEPTKFENVRTGSITYGCRIYDDNDVTYTNTWGSIPDDDLDVIAGCIADFKGCEGFNPFGAMMESLQTEECGVNVGNEWYDWDDIKHLFGY